MDEERERSEEIEMTDTAEEPELSEEAPASPEETPAEPESAPSRGSDRKCFVDRELSWLQFNLRVLETAGDPAVPLLERLKFLGIYRSNMEEFFMVRVGSLTHRSVLLPNERDEKTGWTAAQRRTTGLSLSSLTANRCRWTTLKKRRSPAITDTAATASRVLAAAP